MDNNLFWIRVKQQLKLCNKTQESLCNETGIVIGTMRGWITHSRLPTADDSVKIAQALGTTVEYLVTGKQTPPYQLISALEKMQSVIDEFR